jgi:threonylcarbamoyladenosine tRNA methylthiotransferase MtaB
MPHLHLPLQSGSDAVLRHMARRCKTTEFSTIVQQAREQIPNFNVTTDIIVGFPGETEQEWQESYAFIEQIGFGHIHIFTYSPRQGTKAATLPNPVIIKEKKQRSQQLHQLAKTMKSDFQQRNLGQNFSVLWEAQTELLANDQIKVFGYTPNYLRVATLIPADRSFENQIIPAKPVAIFADHLIAEIQE